MSIAEQSTQQAVTNTSAVAPGALGLTVTVGGSGTYALALWRCWWSAVSTLPISSQAAAAAISTSLSPNLQQQQQPSSNYAVMQIYVVM